MLALSPKGTVPVLVLSDAVIEQSLDIMLWALKQNDPQSWLASSAAGMDEQLALIKQCDGDFKHHLDRYKYPNRYQLTDGLSDRQAGSVFLTALNQRLLAHAFLSGDKWGLADAAIAPFVRQFAHTDPEWFATQPWGKLMAWLNDFEHSTPYLQAMHKYKVWHPDAKPVSYPAV